jgi:hypothetical protein
MPPGIGAGQMPPGIGAGHMPPAPPAADTRARIEAALQSDHLAPILEPAPRARRRGVSGSAVAWSLLATAAVAYLSVVVMRPDLVARMNEAAPSPAVAEVEALRGEVDGLRRDVSEIRTAVSETGAQQKILAERIAALVAPVAETPLPAAATGRPPPALRLDSAPVNGPISPRADAGPLATQPAAAKIAQAKVLNAPKPDLETGSVRPVPPASPESAPAPAAAAPAAAPAEPPPFGPAVVKAAPNPVGVQIASGSSLESLRLSWNLLSETHADKLKSLEPRYTMSVENGGVVYNLMAGPVKSEADAKKMCKALAAKAIPCKVVGEFGGASL